MLAKLIVRIALGRSSALSGKGYEPTAGHDALAATLATG
jgi:hypothetical protein